MARGSFAERYVQVDSFLLHRDPGIRLQYSLLAGALFHQFEIGRRHLELLADGRRRGLGLVQFVLINPRPLLVQSLGTLQFCCGVDFPRFGRRRVRPRTIEFGRSRTMLQFRQFLLSQ